MKSFKNKDLENIKQPDRYRELDALRGIAALMVVFFHFTMGLPEADFGFKLGTTGVDLFFMISGFVIFMSLSKIKTGKDFIINRVSRLYPTYWACVTLTFLMIVALSVYRHEDIPFIKYLGNLTMFQFYLGTGNLDSPYWTMIIEMLFYIVMLLLFQFGWLKHINSMGVILSVLVVVVTSFFYTSPVENIFYYIPLLQFVPLFFAGIIFYKIYTGISKPLGSYFILCTCLISQVLLFNYSGRSVMFIPHYQYAIMITLYFILFTLFVNNKLKFIISKPTLFLGKISFALYLIHQLLSVTVLIPLLTHKLGLNIWVAMVITLPVILVLAALITYYIEVPFGRKMKEKLRVLTN